VGVNSATISCFHIVLGIGIITLAAMTSSNAQLPPSTARADSTDTFQVAFGMSYYGFDWCGDRPLGELYRRALLEKFAQCPFTDEAKRRFSSWTANISARDKEAEKKFIAEHGKLPDRLDGMKQTCQEHRQSADYLKVRERLDRYARAEINVGDVIFSCDTPAVIP
jgi:hypothetical protein